MTRTATKPDRKKRLPSATPWNQLKEGLEKPKKDESEKKESPGMVNGKPVVTSQKKEYLRVRKGEFRKKKRMESRQTGRACYNCREETHTLANCPKMIESHEHSTGMCYKCGSLEHTHKKCMKRMGYKNATCFVCHKEGHISRSCPDNPNGVYPNGGGCLECGSVRHFARDCPNREKQKGIHNMVLSTKWDGSADVDDTKDLETDDNDNNRKPPNKIIKRGKKKVVKF